MKTKHLPSQIQDMITAEAFVSFGVVVPTNVCAFSNK